MRCAYVFVTAVLYLLSLDLVAGAPQDRAAGRCGPPPLATPVPALVRDYGHARPDEYAWLRDANDPKVKAYLSGENAYARCHLAILNSTVDEIATELRGRLGQQETRPPFLNRSYLYQARYAQNANYPTIVRWLPNGGKEQIVLDVPALALSHQYYGLDNWSISPDEHSVAFAVDLRGDRRHHLFLRNIGTGSVTELAIADAGSDLAFSSDNNVLFYVRLDPVSVRAYQIWRRDLSTGADALVYSEPDVRSEVSVYLSKSRKFILINSEREDSTEVSYIPADQPDAKPIPIAHRRKRIRYFADHVDGRFFIRTNLDAPDYRLMVSPESSPDQWSEIIPNEPGKYMRGFQAFKNFVAIEQEHDATVSVRVFRLSDRREISIPLTTDISVMTLDSDANREPDTHVVRVRFSRLNRAERSYDFNMAGSTLAALPESQKSDWLVPDRYAVERIVAWADDLEQVPVTLIYRKDLRQPQGNPTLLYGYGAYGDSTLPDFDPTIFSLVDRGFIYALAHVRGGRERGERWYVGGRQLEKRNSFTDFISAAETLIKTGYAAPHALFAQGASAGGLLVAAAVNMRPSLFAGIVAEVPFVDVVTTASDPSVPTATLEYREWGDPRVNEQYKYMLSYSPYDNVARKAYPPILVTGALHDTQVTVREPAKWVARLRARKTDHHELLFKVDAKAGHHGASGRIGSIQDVAEIQAWLLSGSGLAAFSAAGVHNPN
jgi:oligopeptidase B